MEVYHNSRQHAAVFAITSREEDFQPCLLTLRNLSALHCSLAKVKRCTQEISWKTRNLSCKFTFFALVIVRFFTHYIIDNIDMNILIYLISPALTWYYYTLHRTRLYFSAQWCPPCRRFTPLLGEAYTAHKQYIQDNNIPKEDIEVIFVSLDSVQTDFDTYRSKMPFYSVPFANLRLLNLKEKLSGRYGVRSIPTLVILNGQDGSVITKNGKGEYATYFKGEYEVPSSCCIS